MKNLNKTSNRPFPPGFGFQGETNQVQIRPGQIGKPFAGIRDQHKRSLVQQARIEAIKRLGVVAKDSSVEFVLVAGDLFDSPSADKSTVSAACSAIGEIGLPIFVIPGNHDHGGPGSVWVQDFFLREQSALAPNMTVLLEPAPHECESAVLLPCPLLRRSLAVDPTEWLRSSDAYVDLPTDKPRIVLAHGSTQAFSGQWEDDEDDGAVGNLLDLSRLPDGEIDYIALGDWHGTKEVHANRWPPRSAWPSPNCLPRSMKVRFPLSSTMPLRTPIPSGCTSCSACWISARCVAFRLSC